jgi:hypothetical protein
LIDSSTHKISDILRWNGMTQEGWTWNDVLKTSKSLENFIPDTNEGIPASLSVSDVGESADVLATVSSIGIIFLLLLLLMVLTRYWDEKDKRSEVTSSSLATVSTKMFKGANRKSQRLSRFQQSPLFLDRQKLALDLPIRLLVAQVQTGNESEQSLAGDRVLLLSRVPQSHASAVSVLEHHDHVVHPVRHLQHR